MEQLNALAYLTAPIRCHRRRQVVASLLPKRRWRPELLQPNGYWRHRGGDMVKSKSQLVPAVARLPATLPIERRNVAARQALLRRILAEFEGMPGLSLTLVQATKLFGVSPDASSRILPRLTEEGLLRLRIDDQYVLRTEQS
jgi:hypothetical protein